MYIQLLVCPPHGACIFPFPGDLKLCDFGLARGLEGEAADAFDVTREPESARERYGDTVHGRQTLIGRRLLERGVRFVQLWHGAGQPWDNHDKIEAAHRKLSSEIDRPIAALLGHGDGAAACSPQSSLVRLAAVLA